MGTHSFKSAQLRLTTKRILDGSVVYCATKQKIGAMSSLLRSKEYTSPKTDQYYIKVDYGHGNYNDGTYENLNDLYSAFAAFIDKDLRETWA